MKNESTLKYAEHKLDEAIKQGEPDETIAYWRGYRDCAKAMTQDAANAFKEAWISVKDKLPEPDDEKGVYWVAKKKNNGQWQMKMALFCDYGYAMPVDAKTEVTWRDFDYTKIVNVSHWMPLPELPDELEKRLRG